MRWANNSSSGIRHTDFRYSARRKSVASTTETKTVKCLLLALFCVQTHSSGHLQNQKACYGCDRRPHRRAGDGSVVKNVCCSCEGPRLGFPHTRQSAYNHLQLHFQGNPTLSALRGHCTHVMDIKTHTATHTNYFLSLKQISQEETQA